MRLKLVTPGPGGAAGVDGNTKGLSRTSPNLSTLATDPCMCGPGRTASNRYTCITCLGFARIGRRVEAREAHRYTERRVA